MRRRPAHHAFERALLDEGAPRAAVVALALPLRALHAAFLTDEDRFRLFHSLNLLRFRGHGGVRRTRWAQRLLSHRRRLRDLGVLRTSPCPRKIPRGVRPASVVLSFDASAKPAEYFIRNG